MSLAEELIEELNCETVFTLHVGGLDIPVMESVVVTWIVMAVLILVAIFLTRGLKTQNISKRQAFAELIYEKLTGIVGSMLGEEGKQYTGYLTTVLLYIGLSNVIGLFGFKSPTKDLNVGVSSLWKQHAFIKSELKSGFTILQSQSQS